MDYVVKEWQVARGKKIPDVLIVEEGVNVDESSDINFIRFNRTNPQAAINKLFERNKTTAAQKKKMNNDDVADVLLGVAVVAGIAALISLLSKNK